MSCKSFILDQFWRQPLIYICTVELTPRIVELGWSEAELEADQASETPTTSATSSPAVIEDRKKKVRVAIAKLKVTIHELNDEMDKAAEKKEFMKGPFT